MARCLICKEKYNKEFPERHFTKHDITYDEYILQYDMKLEDIRLCRYCRQDISQLNKNLEFCDTDCRDKYNKDLKHKKSLTLDSKIICKICGFKTKHMIYSHIQNTHNMTSEEYKEKFNLTDEECCSEEYSKQVSNVDRKNYFKTWYRKYCLTHPKLIPLFTENDNLLTWLERSFKCKTCGNIIHGHKEKMQLDDITCRICEPLGTKYYKDNIDIILPEEELRDILIKFAYSENGRLNPNVTNVNKMIEYGRKHILDSLNFHTKHLFPIDNYEDMKEKMFVFTNDIKSKDKCCRCDNEVHFNKSRNVYITTCKNCIVIHKSEETGKKLLGRIQPQEEKDKRANSIRGKTRTDEQKLQLSKSLKNSDALKSSMALYRATEQYEINKKVQSKLMKDKIASGEFTPNITNSWTHFDTDIDGKKFRSSFEGMFYLFKNNYKGCNVNFEKLRIPYFYEGSKKTYIVDFIDYDKKTVYEIKPSILKDDDKNLLKNEALLKWCIENEYKFYYVDETHVYKIYWTLIDNNFTHEFLEKFYSKYQKPLEKYRKNTCQ